MSEQSSGASPEFLVGEPQPLDFRLLSDDGQAAVYEALVVDCETPGTPVFGLTVTVASSIRSDPGNDLAAFLGEMEAAFVLLPTPPPDDGRPDVEQPFDIETQAKIEFRLASFTGPEPAGIALTVVTTVGPGSAPAGSAMGDTRGGPTIHTGLPHHIGAGQSHYWHSNSDGSFTAHVTPSIGDGTLSSDKKKPIALHQGKPSSMSGKEVTVTASPDRGMTYNFTGSAHLGSKS